MRILICLFSLFLIVSFAEGGVFSRLHAKRADVHAAKAAHARLAVVANHHARRSGVHAARAGVKAAPQAPKVEAKK